MNKYAIMNVYLIMDEHISNEEKNTRGGTGSKGNPVEIKRAIAEATKDLKRASHDLEKIARNKEELLHDLAELRVHENEDVPSVIKKAIEKSIRAVQKKLKEVNEILPEVNLTDDQKKIHKIITEWKENKKILSNARRALARGEHKLATEPTNQRAMGDVNRAEATIYDTDQKMQKLAQEAILVEENSMHDPLANETINIHTGGEENNTHAQKEVHIATPQEVTEIPSPAPEPVAPSAPPSVPQESGQQEADGILYTHEQALADQQAWEQKHRSSIEKIITSALGEVTHGDSPQAVTTETPTVIQPPEPSVAEPSKTELTIPETPLLLDDGNDTPQENIVGEKNEEHITPQETNQSVQEIPVSESTPQEIQTSTGTTGEQNTPTTSRKPEHLPPYVEKVLNDHLDKLFGSKGFLGFGTTKGRNSRHWTDPTYGFSRKTISEIRDPQEIHGEPASESWGVANEQERIKMQGYILQASNQTGVTPNPDEKVIDYIKRVLEITAHNNNGQQQTS